MSLIVASPSRTVLTAESFVEGCARCINAINSNEEMPLKLPTGMSARFRVGTTLAKACQVRIALTCLTAASNVPHHHSFAELNHTPPPPSPSLG